MPSPGADELRRTKRIINEELDMIEDLKRTPRKMGLFERFINFIKEKVFHSVSYVREENLGAQIIDPMGEKQSRQSKVEVGNKKQPERTDEKENVQEKEILVPEHKSNILFKLRDNKARENTFNHINVNDRSYIQFKDTGYMARIDKTTIEFENENGLLVQAEGYKMTVYNDKGVMVGKIPDSEKHKEPMTKNEMQEFLSNKGYIETLGGREFVKILDAKEYSLNSLDKTINAVMDKLYNPYIDRMSYKNIDISQNSKGGMEFIQHINSEKYGSIDVKFNPQRSEESYEYLYNKMTDELFRDIKEKKTPEVTVHLDMDKMSTDINKYFKEKGKDNAIVLSDKISIVADPEKEDAFTLLIKQEGEQLRVTNSKAMQVFIESQIEKGGIELDRFNEIHDSINHTRTVKAKNQKRMDLSRKLDQAVFKKTYNKIKDDMER